MKQTKKLSWFGWFLIAMVIVGMIETGMWVYRHMHHEEPVRVVIET